MALLLTVWVLGLAAGENLVERLRQLRIKGEYELAERLVDDQLSRGVPETRPLNWMRAQLTTDPDRFDRIAASITSGSSAEDSLTQEIIIARAKEYFARGRYLSSVELLGSLPPGVARQHTDAALFEGMGLTAAGEISDARRHFLSIDEKNPSYAMSQTLLGQLSLRVGDPRSALRYAESALATANEDVAPQALYVRAQALQQTGEEQRSEKTRNEILRRFPRTAESAWVREEGVQPQSVKEREAQTAIAEVEAPARRRSFALQLGAFHDRGLALRLGRTLKTQVEDLRIERDGSQSPPWYRVVGGRFPNRRAAESARDDLKKRGWETVILAPGQS